MNAITMLTRSDRIKKRTFDIVLSVVGLVATLPIVIAAWVVASVETRSNGLFVQKRIGRYGCHFKVYKIKTMKADSGDTVMVTTSNDRRITKSGAFFRRTKIDELPQLFNVLIGDMSFVGPRPDVPGYADRLEGEARAILELRPGITGPASLKYKNEEEILAQQKDPKMYNDTVIWPDKVAINLQYMQNWSFKKDMEYIVQTIKG